MPQLLWDASALVKRYLPEAGTEAVDALFQQMPTLPMSITYLGHAETTAILRRRVNSCTLNPTDFINARIAHRRDVFGLPGLDLLSVTDQDVLDGITLNDRHNLNASDAAILVTYLRYARTQPPGSPVCLFVASDHRFLRAATAEGLRTLDPEQLPASEVPAFLAGLP